MAIPATPLMTVYQFDGPTSVPLYDAGRVGSDGRGAPIGTLAQGSAVIPCVVVRDGRPLTDRDGTPYVGFELVFDASRATPQDADRYRAIVAERRTLRVADHRCPPQTRQVIDARVLVARDAAPRFEAPASDSVTRDAGGSSARDRIVRAFHASPQCAGANRGLLGRRDALLRAWTDFTAAQAGHWPNDTLRQARQLDLAMRTALYEGHLERGCNAYGACERNAIALSIRNRARERCLRGQGCRSDGDIEGVATTVSQYNIWDEYLTQTTGLTACFLRPDLAADPRTARVQAMYAQNVGDVERILFGDADDLRAVFPGTPLDDLRGLRHYYHPPAMGKCFAPAERVEYITAAVARRGEQVALLVNTRIRVDDRDGDGFRFRLARVSDDAGRDAISYDDAFPGFVVDGRKVSLEAPKRCTPHGVSRRCQFAADARLRRTPPWIEDGVPVTLTCRVPARGADCRAAPEPQTVRVGGRCDVEMQPVAGVP
ncbi:MAG: hypothetical protein SF182_02570 [Deltaproteobacteria bacterium]|nr:hypothetical protein [Deltaproteobacteria bacterium]